MPLHPHRHFSRCLRRERLWRCEDQQTLPRRGLGGHHYFLGRSPRHSYPRAILLSLVALWLLAPLNVLTTRAQRIANPAPAGRAARSDYVSDADVEALISKYRLERSDDQVAAWSRWGRTSSDPIPVAFREAAIRNLPAPWVARRNTDERLDAPLRALLAPVLTLYHRDYTLFIIDSPLPAILIDSGAVLVVSTGLLRRAESDDELIGFLAHEVAHSFFSERSVAAKELYAALLAQRLSDSPGALAALRALAKVELECDAVAARTLSVLRLNPSVFITSVEGINRDFPAETSRGTELGVNWHPPTTVRRRVVEALAGVEALRRQPRKCSNVQPDHLRFLIVCSRLMMICGSKLRTSAISISSITSSLRSPLSTFETNV